MAELRKLAVTRAAGPSLSSLDLHFQEMSWIIKRVTQENLVPAHDFFNQALYVESDKFQALVGSERVGAQEGANPFVVDPERSFSKAQAKFPGAYPWLPNTRTVFLTRALVSFRTRRAFQGIVACAQALALDRTLARLGRLWRLTAMNFWPEWSPDLKSNCPAGVPY